MEQHKFYQPDILSCLTEIVQKNTRAYTTDFDFDAKRLWDSAQESDIPSASGRAAIHLSSAAVSGHCISTICICYPRARNAHKRFHLKRGQRYVAPSSIGSNFSFCKSIT